VVGRGAEESRIIPAIKTSDCENDNIKKLLVKELEKKFGDYEECLMVSP
jgi:hypothetical protein